MNTTFTTKGTLSGFDSEGYIFIEEEPTGRPVMLWASKNLRSYIDDVSSSDKEEKYMACEYVFSPMCSLIAVIVPSADEMLPAKMVFDDWKNQTLKIFGTTEIIDEVSPEAMHRREWFEALDYLREEYEIKPERAS